MTKITLQVSEAEKDALQNLATASGLKLSAYIRYFLEEAIVKGAKINRGNVTYFNGPIGLVAEEQAPYFAGTPAKKKKTRPSGPTPFIPETG